MNQPHVTRLYFPPGYVDHPKTLLSWSQVEQKLTGARNYWLCTVRPDGTPHSIPKWAVYADGKIYFDGSLETRHARNILKNLHVSLHLESGDEAVIVEGLCTPSPKPTPEFGMELAKVYAAKYAAIGYSPKSDSWDNGGLFEISPHVVLAWTNFVEDPTKFVFGS